MRIKSAPRTNILIVCLVQFFAYKNVTDSNKSDDKIKIFNALIRESQDLSYSCILSEKKHAISRVKKLKPLFMLKTSRGEIDPRGSEFSPPVPNLFAFHSS